MTALNIRRITLTALMAALIFVLTRMVQIPTPARGYIHLGDAGIVFASLAFGPWVGALAGGIGTGLADISSGYAQWAPFSLLIHGLQGALIGWLVRREINRRTLTLASIASVAIVVVGYFLAGLALMGAAAAAELPANTVQGLSGVVLGTVVYIAVVQAYPPLLRTSGRSS